MSSKRDDGAMAVVRMLVAVGCDVNTRNTNNFAIVDAARGYDVVAVEVARQIAETTVRKQTQIS